jgi:hypothetical protein
MSGLSLDMGLSDLSVSTSTPYFTVVLRKASAEISLAPASVPRARERIDHYPTCRGGGWYLLVFGISPSSQGKESAQFPGQFTESSLRSSDHSLLPTAAVRLSDLVTTTDATTQRTTFWEL